MKHSECCERDDRNHIGVQHVYAHKCMFGLEV